MAEREAWLARMRAELEEEIVRLIEYFHHQTTQQERSNISRLSDNCGMCFFNFSEISAIGYFTCGHIYHYRCYTNMRVRRKGICPWNRELILLRNCFHFVVDENNTDYDPDSDPEYMPVEPGEVVDSENEESEEEEQLPNALACRHCRAPFLRLNDPVRGIRRCACFYHVRCFENAYEVDIALDPRGAAHCVGCGGEFRLHAYIDYNSHPWMVGDED
ncbi:hypothetical protein ABFS83_08G139300 [Erythranthe nasuta]